MISTDQMGNYTWVYIECLWIRIVDFGESHHYSFLVFVLNRGGSKVSVEIWVLISHLIIPKHNKSLWMNNCSVVYVRLFSCKWLELIVGSCSNEGWLGDCLPCLRFDTRL